MGNEPQYSIDVVAAMAERVIKRLWIVIIILIALLAATNGAWIWYESQFVEEVTETVESTAEGNGNAYGTLISGDNSEVCYGEGESDKDNKASP